MEPGSFILLKQNIDNNVMYIIRVTHDQETCTRNLYRIEHRSIRWKFLVQVSSTSFSSVCHLCKTHKVPQC